MSDGRLKTAKLNMKISLLCQFVTVVCGIVIPRYMITAFGSELYGATAAITQFLAYVTLLEGGIGGVARASLYKPLADNDNDKICEIFWELKKFFNIIGCIFIVYMIGIALSFKYISDIKSIDWITTFVLVVVISISTMGQHFIGISNAVVLQAAQKIYITNITSTITTIINTCMIIVLVNCGCGIITVKLVSSCVFLLRPIILSVYVKKNFGVKKVDKRTNHLKNKWDGLGQHISFFLHSNVDIVILTLFGNLSLVAVYSIYKMVVGNIQNIIVSFTSGMEAYFGDMLAKNESEILDKRFRMYEICTSTVSTILIAVTTILIIPFVRIYTAGVDDVNYIQPLFAVMMALASYLYCIRQPFHAVIIAAGHFKETNLAAYGEVFINVVLSVILVSKFGLVGVAIGTVVAVLFRFIYYIYYLSNNIMFRTCSIAIRQISLNGLLLSGSVVGLFIIENYMNIATYVHWIVIGVISTVLVSALVLLVNYLIYKEEYSNAIKAFLK